MAGTQEWRENFGELMNEKAQARDAGPTMKDRNSGGFLQDILREGFNNMAPNPKAGGGDGLDEDRGITGPDGRSIIPPRILRQMREEGFEISTEGYNRWLEARKNGGFDSLDQAQNAANGQLYGGN